MKLRYRYAITAAVVILQLAFFVPVATGQPAPSSAPPLDPVTSAPRAADYRPEFVRQGQNNCAFASAVMLIDKWTRGKTILDQHRLRRLSGIPSIVGITAGGLQQILRKVTGLDVAFSPYGGDPMTWRELLARLADGSGAIISGSYAELAPRWRWTAFDGGHSMYLDRYDADSDRLWVMDPLVSKPGHRGRWIPASDIARFIWKNGAGHVHAVTSPVPPRPPLEGYSFDPGQPASERRGVFAGQRLDVVVPVAERGPEELPELHLVATWDPFEPPPVATDDPPAADDLAADDAPAADDLAAEGLRHVVTGPASGQDVLEGGLLPDPPPPDADQDDSDTSVETDETEETDESERAPSTEAVAVVHVDGELQASFTVPDDAGWYRLTFVLRRKDKDAPQYRPGEALEVRVWPLVAGWDGADVLRPDAH